MAILTQSGRIVLAESVAARALHLAWGTGDGAWTIAPPENPASVALQAEVGRRQITAVGYAVPDPAGLIVLDSGNFSVSVTPTKYLYIQTQFDFLDAQSTVIREIAVFAGSTTVAGLPAGQRYFVPAEIATTGRMLHTQNLVPIFRSPAIRENFEIVIEF